MVLAMFLTSAGKSWDLTCQWGHGLFLWHPSQSYHSTVPEQVNVQLLTGVTMNTEAVRSYEMLASTRRRITLHNRRCDGISETNKEGCVGPCAHGGTENKTRAFCKQHVGTTDIPPLPAEWYVLRTRLVPPRYNSVGHHFITRTGQVHGRLMTEYKTPKSTTAFMLKMTDFSHCLLGYDVM
jgi:hypothetical protein